MKPAALTESHYSSHYPKEKHYQRWKQNYVEFVSQSIHDKRLTVTDLIENVWKGKIPKLWKFENQLI